MNYTFDLYSPLSGRIEHFSNAIAFIITQRKDLWIEKCIRQFCPGIHTLVNSGQNYVASRYMQAQGFHLAEHRDGRTEFRCHDKVLATLEAFNP